MNKKLQHLENVISEAQTKFAEMLEKNFDGASISLESYQRYLSMQYHLTKGVHRYFYIAASHADLYRMKSLRKFLTQFANEEERHFLVAAKDLEKLSLDLLPEPFDVTLWHSYFQGIVQDRPFIRLGAATILENISNGSAKKVITSSVTSADFLNESNTKFLVIHQHETLPHGLQILDALDSASLNEAHMQDLLLGAKQGYVMFARMIDWALNPDTLSSWADHKVLDMDQNAALEIQNFSMQELDPMYA